MKQRPGEVLKNRNRKFVICYENEEERERTRNKKKEKRFEELPGKEREIVQQK